MFTGITRGTFPVVSCERNDGVLRYRVALPPQLRAGLGLGQSVAIDGVCQTVVELDTEAVTFEAIRETLERTTLDALTAGRRVSVERSARVGDEIGGHEVAGHVIGRGAVVEIRRDGANLELRVAVSAKWMKHIFEKGFIAVDGSSLTVSRPAPEGRFSVHLIPETIRLTNLGRKSVGDKVNIELDPRTVAIVETVERVLAARGRLT